MTLRLITGILVLSLLGITTDLSAAVIQISPHTAADCHEEFVKIANTCRHRRAAAHHTPGRQYRYSKQHRDRELLISNPSRPGIPGGSTGVCFIGGHHITLEDSEIYETGNNAISLNYGNTDYFVFRRNHIHHTGLSTSGPTEGEGFYAGCNNDTCRTTNSLFEGNYIHHLRGTSDGGNDGIKIKVGSYNNVVRNNVIHDTTIGRRYPCIFVYGGGSGLNVVEGNVMWNCGEAIQVVSDAVIRNNIILNSDVGITSDPHVQVAQMRNVTIVNNTLYDHRRCLYVRWDSAAGMTLANNAIFCPGATAVDASGLEGSSITVRANYVEGGLAGASLDQSQFFNGGTAATAFTNPQTLEFFPRPAGSLVGKSDAAFTPANDFNGRPRGAPADVGAYEANGLASNPGWRIVPGFKRTPVRRGEPEPRGAIHAGDDATELEPLQAATERSRSAIGSASSVGQRFRFVRLLFAWILAQCRIRRTFQ